MANSFTNIYKASILNFIFSDASYTPPETWYIGLSTTTSNSNTGGDFTEPTASSYARLSITANATNFPITSNGTMTNGVDLEFVECTDLGGWGTVVDFGIFTAPTGGTAIATGVITNPSLSPITITHNTTMRIKVGNMTVTWT